MFKEVNKTKDEDYQSFSDKLSFIKLEIKSVV